MANQILLSTNHPHNKPVEDVDMNVYLLQIHSIARIDPTIRILVVCTLKSPQRISYRRSPFYKQNMRTKQNSIIQ